MKNFDEECRRGVRRAVLAAFFAAVAGGPIGAARTEAAAPTFTCDQALDEAQSIASHDLRSVSEAEKRVLLLRQAEERCLGVDRPASLRARTLLATISLPENSDRKKQLDLVDRALEILRAEDPKHPMLVEALERKGDLEFDLGRRGEALAFYQEALDLREDLYGRRSSEYIEGRLLLVNFSLAQSQIEERRVNLQKARLDAEELLAEAERFLTADDSAMRGAWSTYAEILRAFGEFEEADRIVARHLQ